LSDELSRLPAVNQFGHLPGDDVDTGVRVSEPAAAVTLDDADWPWLDDSEATRKRGGEGKRRSGRRRYDAYGVAGRFGRSADD